jgi:hypothetical protein
MRRELDGDDVEAAPWDGSRSATTAISLEELVETRVGCRHT